MFYRTYIQQCKQNYIPMGFRKKGKTLFCSNKEVICAFTLNVVPSECRCFVEFDVFPLCTVPPIYLNSGRYSLEGFLTDPHNNYFTWHNSSESISSCVNRITELVDNRLIPIFDKCTNCESALFELLRLEMEFERNRLAKLKQMGTLDCASNWKDRSLFDAKKYYMALKAKNYTYARQYLEHEISHYKNIITSLKDPKSSQQPKIVKERFVNTLNSRLDHLSHLSAEEYSFFEDLLCSNEQRMLDFLRKTGIRLRSTD